MSGHCPVGVASPEDRGARWWRAALWIAVALGVALRLRRFACDRSLWGDETLLALNVVGRTWSGLLHPLSHGQVAPVGFLWLEKLVVTWFGEGEAAWRVPPLLASVAALVLFRRVALALLTPAAALFAVLFLALAEPHVFYAASVKQYSFDVFVVLLLIDRALALHSAARPSRAAWWSFAAIGGLAQLLSHAAVLSEAAIGGALLIAALRDPSRRWRVAVSCVVAAWLAVFIALYFACIRASFRNPYLHAFWADAYAPLLPRSVADLQWYATRLCGYFSDPLAATPAWLAAAFTLLGLCRRPERAGGRLLLAGPLLVALLASMAGCYPFSTGLDADLGSGRFNWNGRLLLFTTPGIVLVGAAGLQWLADRFARGGRVAARVAGVVLLLVPAGDAVRNFVAPPRLQEIGPAVTFMRDRIRPGDVEFVRAHSQPSFRYYARRYGVAIQNDVFEVTDAAARRDLRDRIAALPVGQRVWLFHVDGLGESPEVAAFSVRTGVGRVAALRDSFEAERVHVWLFEVDGGAAWRGGKGR